ncbi:MAG: SCO family protein [Candidatus Omnitrophica bacterium]|nr:SCO family protein [Candidatus Omnitrophota bacterium]
MKTRVKRRAGKIIASGCGMLAFLIILGLPMSMPASAQDNQEPEELKGVGVDEQLNSQTPLDVPFTTAENKEVRFGDFVTGEKPVILNLAYFSCPMLCGLIWDGMLESLQSIPLNIGEDFDVVTLSIDPLETPSLAKVKKQNMLKQYGREGANLGWHYLVGKEENIRRITDAAGFNYKWVESRKEYAHPAVLIILTPDGRISRYLYGIQFDSQTLRLSLVEASEGKIGTTLDHFILTCFQYDPTANRYAPVAMNIMRMGGILTVLILGIFLGGFWMKELRRKKSRHLAEGT